MASEFGRQHAIPRRAGVGLKPEHYRAILETRPDIGFFEVHAENYMGAGGPPHRYLAAIRDRYPISLHGVGLSIGADRPLDRAHLQRLKELIARYEPGLFSEHLAWSTLGPAFLDDLLPVPYTAESLTRICAHINETQDALGRRILLENPATYLAFAESIYSETDFIAEVVRRTGCALLLDVNNVYVASTNQKWDPVRYIDAFPLAHVREIHLAGHVCDTDEKSRPLLIDSHDRPVADAVWALYEHAVALLGPLPTLIEWDAQLPDWTWLQAEAERAEAVMLAASQRSIAVSSLAERQADFAAALLDPARPAPRGLIGPDGADSPRRFAVYRNNVTVALTDALQANFPATCRLVGAAFFHTMARTYALSDPPASPILLDYGVGLADFIATFAPAAALPYLADIARIERAWTEAYHAPEAHALDPALLSNIPQDEAAHLCFRLHPSVRIVRSPFPALTIWRMNVVNGVPEPVDLDAGGEDVLLVRPEAEVEIRSMPAGGAEFIAALADGHTLLESAKSGLRAASSFDLAANLTALIGAGVFIDSHPAVNDNWRAEAARR